MPEHRLDNGWGEAQNLFDQGKTAMMKFWAHAYHMTPVDSKVSGKVGVAPMIAGSAGIAGIPGPWYNVIPTTSTHKDAARKFIAYAFAQTRWALKLPSVGSGQLWAYKSYMGKPGYEYIGPLLETLGAPATKGRPINAKYQELVDEAVMPAFQGALECKDNVADLLKSSRDRTRHSQVGQGRAGGVPPRPNRGGGDDVGARVCLSACWHHRVPALLVAYPVGLLVYNSFFDVQLINPAARTWVGAFALSTRCSDFQPHS